MPETRCDELVEHLVATTPLGRGGAERVVAEVVAYFSETTEAFVRRRHRELLGAGLGNAEAFARIAGELDRRPVAAPDLSLRQLRRIVYG